MRSFTQTLLLVTLALATTTIPPTSARSAKRLVEGLHFECWRQVGRVEGCRQDLQSSLEERRIRLGLDCCKAIEGLGNACFREVFRYGPYSLLYGKAVKGYCSWIESPPSPPVYLPQSTPSV
ncbi:egg cell-secreted protein 1.2-like [Actinidia eriantha]|uniref:egg cell-secreted protein 1.2-like n=1 Tax=Actinidia eriantha TaxID=165200 RepID=UPI00258D812C|nr:egg cell-secreted protein 1.2-like [Actinidia eriantha]